MTKEILKQLIETGREIEFTYNNKNYSITYYGDERENYISFCEFNKETTDVKSVEDLCLIARENVTVIEMLNSLNDSDISIY